MPIPLSTGLYEQLITSGLRQSASDSQLQVSSEALDNSEAPRVLARHFATVVERALNELPEKTRATDAVGVVNGLLQQLNSVVPGFHSEAEDVVTPELLLALMRRDPLATAASHGLPRPGIPLSDNALLVNARGEHRIGDEIGRELPSADSVDLLCSFLVWSGYIRIRDSLEAMLRRGGKLRILTTVYCGVTERRVLDALCALGATVKISYDTRRTRLHAKAWLFKRNTGFHTAYVGSSNLSAPAMTDGLEWNVRVSAVDSPQVLEKFRATFDGYWEDPEFEAYDPARDAARFDEAVGNAGADDENRMWLVPGRVTLFPYQEGILEQLNAERRVHGRWRNLVVAATGTGKTVMAAVDYRREIERHGKHLRLLFVAHRKEILEQSRKTFRAVLDRHDFGGLLVDGERPRPGQDVFASIQSLARMDLASIPKDAYDYVLVDEFHHAEADSYKRLLNHLTPKILLGLTATPERADGQDLKHWFEDKVAAELRLWDAVDRGLLCPFQYFGIDDDVDISAHWKRGMVDLAALDQVYSSHDARAAQVIHEVQRHVASPRQMKALGFCAGVSHARFMAKKFNAAGLPADSISGEDATDERAKKRQALERGDLCALFSVDVFNEGVDIPAVDTVLMLRPTESATIFQQQLGRGLRLAPGKRILTVLDFIANANHEFRFDVRFSAMVGGTRRELEKQVKNDFPVLPAGCAIQLTETAKETVLENIKNALNLSQRKLVVELRALGPNIGLEPFLAHLNLSVDEFYRNGRTMFGMRREAGFGTEPAGEKEAELGKGLSRILTLDDVDALDVLENFLRTKVLPQHVADQRRIMMAAATLTGWRALESIEQAAETLRQHPAVLAELAEVLPILRKSVRHVSLAGILPEAVPLRLHCNYRLEQLLCAFDMANNLRNQAGVILDRVTKSDMLLVTLQKSEKDYSPSTMYKDFALSRTRFHWQSQNSARPDSGAGLRHVQHRQCGVTPLLFVRQSKTLPSGGTRPYTFLGPVECESFEGERPISITWRLLHAMPAELFLETRVAA